MIKRLFFGLLIFLLAGGLQAQPSFPKDWEGHWEGKLLWYKTGSDTPQEVIMQLKIAAVDTLKGWTWQLVYGEAGADNRPYHLLSKDTAKGHWVIDEHNGIVLDQYLVAGIFTGAFTVQKSTIVNSYRLEGDKMIVEFYTLGASPVSTTGQGTAESPAVMSYKINGYQRAELFRKP